MSVGSKLVGYRPPDWGGAPIVRPLLVAAGVAGTMIAMHTGARFGAQTLNPLAKVPVIGPALAHGGGTAGGAIAVVASGIFGRLLGGAVGAGLEAGAWLAILGSAAQAAGAFGALRTDGPIVGSLMNFTPTTPATFGGAW